MSFNHSIDIADFLEPAEVYEKTFHSDNYTTIGDTVTFFNNDPGELFGADLIIVGCNEIRGGEIDCINQAPDQIRKELYTLFNCFGEIKITDLGNIKTGKNIEDTYAAVKIVLKEIIPLNKQVIFLGGTNDLMLPQYKAFEELKTFIEVTCVDALINYLPADYDSANLGYLMKMLMAENNHIKHYNHIGFQSYFVHPKLLESMNRLRFDCFRLGVAKEHLNEMEPVIRNSQLFGFDISAIQNTFAPANKLTPNGFNGEEACTLMQFAGMSAVNNITGIYDYYVDQDRDYITAKQIAQMLWYFMNGKFNHRNEAAVAESNKFNEFRLIFADIETTFLQNKFSGAWWVQLPDGNYMPCSYTDYQKACNNEIPERWLRAVERS